MVNEGFSSIVDGQAKNAHKIDLVGGRGRGVCHSFITKTNNKAEMRGGASEARNDG